MGTTLGGEFGESDRRLTSGVTSSLLHHRRWTIAEPMRPWMNTKKDDNARKRVYDSRTDSDEWTDHLSGLDKGILSPLAQDGRGTPIPPRILGFEIGL
jgi:hypothetical protein